MSDIDLSGKVAVVTGGTRGIGKAIARSLAGEGMDVAIIDTADGRVRTLDLGTRPGAAAAALTLSPDGSVVAAILSDKNIGLWGVADERQVVPLIGHSDRVHAIAFTPTGAQLLSALESSDLAPTGLIPPFIATKDVTIRKLLNADGANDPAYTDARKRWNYHYKGDGFDAVVLDSRTWRGPFPKLDALITPSAAKEQLKPLAGKATAAAIADASCVGCHGQIAAMAEQHSRRPRGEALATELLRPQQVGALLRDALGPEAGRAAAALWEVAVALLVVSALCLLVADDRPARRRTVVHAPTSIDTPLA